MAIGDLSDARKSQSGQELYEFGPFRLDAAERQLFRGDDEIPLTAKTFDILLLLVTNRGRTIPKEEFMATVWPDAVVEEANLTDNVSTLRQILGDDAREPKYIRTLPKRGYRFEAEVTPVQRRRPARGWWIAIVAAAVIIALAAIAYLVRRTRTTSAPPRSIAVLPFKPLGDEHRDRAFELGMTDALIGKLSRIHQLSVRPTSAVMPYADSSADVREIASKLDVDVLLDGKVQTNAGRVRVSVQLIRPSDGSAIWADRFDEPLTDIFSLQDVISERVAGALALEVTAAERQSIVKPPTTNVEAYRLYLNGLHQWRTFTVEGRLASVNYYEAALKLDPNFALAWAGLGRTYNVLGIWGPLEPREAFRKAKDAAEHAIAADPTLGESHMPLAGSKLFFERDWEGVRRELDTVERLDPSNLSLLTIRGYYFHAIGQPEKAQALLERVSERAPDWAIAKFDVLDGLILCRRYDDAIAMAKKEIALDPARNDVHYVLGEAYAAKGQLDAALPPLEQSVELTHEARARYLATLGWVHAKAGRRDKALAILEEAKRDRGPWMPFYVAEIYAGLGDADQTFAWLNRACDEGWAFLWDARYLFHFDAIRPDPRFAALLQRINLKP